MSLLSSVSVIKSRLKSDIERPAIFPDNVIAGVTRKSIEIFPDKGFSPGPSEAFDMEEVRLHRAILAATLDVSLDSLFFQNQVHSVRIVDVEKGSLPQEADGMICTETGLILCICVADCAAVLLYESELKIIAILHSGWRGTRENISGKAIESMVNRYHAHPENILAYVSPCASVQKYEIGMDVAQYFPASFLKPKADGKWFLDLKTCIHDQLRQSAIEERNIEIAPGCTIADPRYHSYRRDRKLSGRMAAFIGSRP